MTSHFIVCCAFIVAATLCLLYGEREVAVALMLMALTEVYKMEPERQPKKGSEK